MNRLCRAAVAASLIGLATADARAQAISASPGSNATVPETAPATTLDRKPGSLSDKLAPTNGVIAPTGDVDPAMHKQPPQSGNMPVVKPGEVPAQPGSKDGGGLD